ncbi:MAG TPA: heavy metal sensor histidine kinase [Acidobacteriota bacterium]|nr:heavy metal sensor histidine kinase [Acidobacteriota bacterium]
MNPRSLRFKLSWMHGLVISLVILFIGFVRYNTVSYRSSRSFDDSLLNDAQFLASHFRLRADGSWVLEASSPGDKLSLEELRSNLIVTDSAGNVIRPDLHDHYMQGFISSGGLRGTLKQGSGFGLTLAAGGDTYRFVNLIAPDSGKEVILHLCRSMESLRGVLNEYFYIYLFSVPVILAISVPVGWYLAGRALKPFEEVATIAEQITSENLNTQITTKRNEQEVRRLVLAFNSMVKRLNESFQQMRKFNADAAHELRTPLSILQGENEIALRSAGLPEEIHSVLASNLEELQRLTRIVNDMLILAEADAGSQVLARKPNNLRPMLEDLVEQMGVLAEDRSIEFDLAEIKDVVIDADPLWLRRAFLNLLDNAIKYSKDSGRIEVRTVLRDGWVDISIRDEGIGIAPHDLPHIFDRLYRADPARSRSSGGVGLGLALVKWIIEAHRGHIRVKSIVDRGTTFKISLPTLNPPAKEDLNDPALT